MSDGSKDTPSPDTSPTRDPVPWEDHAVFRETFLQKLPPRDATACRLLGRRVYGDRHESLAPDEVFDPASWLAGDLKGVLAELTFLAGFLSDSARAPEEYELSADDLALAALAAEARDLISGLMTRIEAQLCGETTLAHIL